MNKPDSYIAFDWPKFQADTFRLTEQQKWCYWNACCAYYWDGCQGLPNDDDGSLRRACDCSESYWPATKAKIFGPFFKLGEDGKWHQKRTKEEYARAVRLMAKRQGQTKAATASRQRNNARYDTVTSDVTSDVTTHVTCVPSPSPSPTPIELPSPPPDNSTTNKQGRGRYPSLEEAKAHAQFIGMSESDAEAFWNHFEASGWIDKNGNQIVRWQPKMATWKTTNQAKPLEDAHKAGESGLSGADKTILSKEYDRVCERIRKIEDGAACDAMGSRYYTESDKAQLSKLKSRRAELRKTLGITI